MDRTLNDMIHDYEERIEALKQTDSLNHPDVKELIEEMLADLQKCVQHNHSLRKTILKLSSNKGKMSTKLKEALYE